VLNGWINVKCDFFLFELWFNDAKMTLDNVVYVWQ
jgi:hypothetical protein